MANFTERAIKKAFLELIEEKPLNKITVIDITERCEISRNSFYYHFKDIPALIESIVKEEFDEFNKKYTGIVSLGEVVRLCLEFVATNGKIILHIYRSENRSVFEKHLWDLCEHVSKDYFVKVKGAKELSEKNQKLLIRLLKCEVFGVISEWIFEGMKITLEERDINECIEEYSDLKLAEIDLLIKYFADR